MTPVTVPGVPIIRQPRKDGTRHLLLTQVILEQISPGMPEPEQSLGGSNLGPLHLADERGKFN